MTRVAPAVTLAAALPHRQLGTRFRPALDLGGRHVFRRARTVGNDLTPERQHGERRYLGSSSRHRRRTRSNLRGILDLGGALNAVVCSRVRELQEALSAATVALAVSSRNARGAALPKRSDALRAWISAARRADMAGLPSGTLSRLRFLDRRHFPVLDLKLERPVLARIGERPPRHAGDFQSRRAKPANQFSVTEAGRDPVGILPVRRWRWRSIDGR